jgi:negative regulator of sigma E activity
LWQLLHFGDGLAALALVVLEAMLVMSWSDSLLQTGVLSVVVAVVVGPSLMMEGEVTLSTKLVPQERGRLNLLT